jgi:hypothetical protein
VKNKRIHRLWIAEGLRVPLQKAQEAPQGYRSCTGGVLPHSALGDLGLGSSVRPDI